MQPKRYLAEVGAWRCFHPFRRPRARFLSCTESRTERNGSSEERRAAWSRFSLPKGINRDARERLGELKGFFLMTRRFFPWTACRSCLIGIESGVTEPKADETRQTCPALRKDSYTQLHGVSSTMHVHTCSELADSLASIANTLESHIVHPAGCVSWCHQGYILVGLCCTDCPLSARFESHVARARYRRSWATGHDYEAWAFPNLELALDNLVGPFLSFG